MEHELFSIKTSKVRGWIWKWERFQRKTWKQSHEERSLNEAINFCRLCNCSQGGYATERLCLAFNIWFWPTPKLGRSTRRASRHGAGWSFPSSVLQVLRHSWQVLSDSWYQGSRRFSFSRPEPAVPVQRVMNGRVHRVYGEEESL